MLEGLPYGHGVDWWVLGIMTFEMLTGYRPYDYNTADTGGGGGGGGGDDDDDDDDDKLDDNHGGGEEEEEEEIEDDDDEEENDDDDDEVDFREDLSLAAISLAR